ncbi:BOI-related E3 ubiquitin-protein like [Actinidia chinensis var. chinensis]|uniref:BOI-related E3 ubiquitin-protein like n=1 Tax=Actinidia chinensis var. chinensis TaxID=1590841 RepID=A0A2R6RMH9_ACTCC|nr:BOI-related E3 ubiquitin-protein like [Actinidia chinensis var. chinensis]
MTVEAQFCSENLGLTDWPMSSVFGIDDGVYLNLQEHPSQQTNNLHHHHQGFQFVGINSYNQGASSTSSGNNWSSMAFSQFLPALLEKQIQEIDWVLHLQNERLKTTLQAESRHQLLFLLQRYESKWTTLMLQRDESLVLATKKSKELQQCLRKIEMEKQNWQRKAKESEAKVAELNSTLIRVTEREAESFCGSSNREESKKMMKNWCKLCRSRRSCVVLLPCRHLCSCKSCEAFVGFCPVCESVKEASMEVYLA